MVNRVFIVKPSTGHDIIKLKDNLRQADINEITALGSNPLNSLLINDVRYIVERQANDNTIAAVAKTEEKNRKEWAEVSKSIDGMVKFNPYNKEAYKTLRAKANMEKGIYDLAALEANCADLNFEEFENQRNQIINNTIQNMNAEGLQAKHTAGYLSRLQYQSFNLKDKYITKKAEKDYQIFQNQIVSSVSKDIATLTYLKAWGLGYY